MVNPIYWVHAVSHIIHIRFLDVYLDVYFLDVYFVFFFRLSL